MRNFLFYLEFALGFGFPVPPLWNYIPPPVGYCDMKRDIKPLAIAFSIVVVLIFGIAFATEAPIGSAADLKPAPDLSFSDDSSANFPIEGKNLSDGSIAKDHATGNFFGTANCWNTAREAQRLVHLYPQYKD